MFAFTSLLQLTQWTKTSANSRSIKFGAGMVLSVMQAIKGPSSEQQGQFSAPVAATHLTMHLMHTSTLYGLSSGCVRRQEHS